VTWRYGSMAPVREAFRARGARPSARMPSACQSQSHFFPARKDLKLAAAWVPDDLFARGALRLANILIRVGDARLLCSNLGKRALNEHPTWMEDVAERELAVWLPRPRRFTCQASERHPNRKRFPDWRAPGRLDDCRSTRHLIAAMDCPGGFERYFQSRTALKPRLPASAELMTSPAGPTRRQVH
jgi:hypothetical protein